MPVPFVIDNLTRRLADTLNDLLGQSAGKPLDIATAYFSISGYKMLKDGLHKLGAFRLLLGTDPQSGADVGLKADPNALKACLKGDLEAEPFTEETLKLVEDLITYLQADKVEIRLYDKGFLHAKAYLFHQDQIGRQNLADRIRPFAAIVGSSNFTGPGLASNRELNLVHGSSCLPTIPVMQRRPEASPTWAMSGSGKPSLTPRGSKSPTMPGASSRARWEPEPSPIS
jgi:hypothetical protein